MPVADSTRGNAHAKSVRNANCNSDSDSDDSTGTNANSHTDNHSHADAERTARRAGDQPLDADERSACF